jgi:hypothetical protein
MDPETRIPVEILSGIFHLLCNKHIALEELDNSLCLDDFPWAAGQVCRHWRTAFVSYPRLWTSLSLRDVPQDRPSVAYLTEMKRRSAIYLERSGQLPLGVILKAQIITAESPITAIWKMLLSCSNRWESADITLPSTESVIDHALLCRARMPILKELSLYCRPEREGQRCYSAFEIAPRLTKLDLALYDRSIGTSMIPWSQLNDLVLRLSRLPEGFASGHELRAFLLELQNIKELALIIDESNLLPATFDFSPIRFPRLIYLGASVTCSRVFAWFETPLLDQLWLYCEPSSHYEVSTEEISSLIDRSLCRISFLALRCCCECNKTACEIMKALASVEVFSAEEYGGDSSLVMYYIGNLDRHIFLPNMRRLKVDTCRGRFGSVVGNISRILEARGKESGIALSSGNMVPLERLTIRMDWGRCGRSGCCPPYALEYYRGRIPLDKAVLDMFSWPSFSITNIQSYKSQDGSITMKACALAAGTPINLTFYYPKGLDDENERYHRILEHSLLQELYVVGW